MVLVLGAMQYYAALAQTSCPFLTGVTPIEKELADLKLKFVGVKPIVTRVPMEGITKPKLVIKKYSHKPTMEVKDGVLTVKPDSCKATGTTASTGTTGNVTTGTAGTAGTAGGTAGTGTTGAVGATETTGATTGAVDAVASTF